MHVVFMVCEIITSKVSFFIFPDVPERDSNILEATKTIFGWRDGLPDFIFLFLVELGTCVQNLMFTKVVKGWQKNYFPPRGMLKFTYRGRYMTIKIAYE
jgi:hypothetical protein